MLRLSKGNGTLAVAYFAAFLSHFSEMMTSFSFASFRRAAADSRCLQRNTATAAPGQGGGRQQGVVECGSGERDGGKPQNRSWLI